MARIHLHTFAEIVAILEDHPLAQAVEAFDRLADEDDLPVTVSLERVEFAGERAKTVEHDEIARWYADNRDHPAFRQL